MVGWTSRPKLTRLDSHWTKHSFWAMAVRHLQSPNCHLAMRPRQSKGCCQVNLGSQDLLALLLCPHYQGPLLQDQPLVASHASRRFG
jgi:hypothetical protein